MNSAEIHQYFSDRITQLRKEKEDAENQVKMLSFLRFGIFVGFCVLLAYFSNLRLFTASISLTFFFILIFGTIIRSHLKAKFKLSQFEYLTQLNQEEIKRLDGELHDLPSGESLMNTQHPYAPDLDIFGFNSLYQLLVRSRLPGTQKVISEWMLQGSEKAEIIERQEAIRELESQVDWRQEVSALGIQNDKNKKGKEALENLSNWLEENLHFIDKPIWGVLEFLMPSLAVILVFGFWLADWPYQLFFIPILINLYLLKVIFVPLMHLTKGFEGIHQVLKGYARIIQKIEEKEFKSTLLLRHADQLKTENQSASKAIHQLSNILQFLQNRANMVYQPLNMIFLFDLIAFRRTLSWKKKYESRFAHWFDAVHHMDALNDLSSYAYANPNFCFAQINDGQHFIESTEMAHPLIKKNKRIANGFKLEIEGQLALITGSNMSGKSTFLRTLGTNLVLAQMGAPVCATAFECSLMQIFTSMRTQDNLEENVSSFYAELKRIKLLLDSLNDEKPVFYMLDEILKGTNSEDRHKGATSLIDQLTHQNCMGLISTHDIQLADLSKNNPKIANYSFNSTIQGDEINFDYKLTDGPCRSFNASKLMEKMGIIKKGK